MESKLFKLLMAVEKFLPKSIKQKLLNYLLKKQMQNITSSLLKVSYEEKPLLGKDGKPIKLNFNELFGMEVVKDNKLFEDKNAG